MVLDISGCYYNYPHNFQAIVLKCVVFEAGFSEALQASEKPKKCNNLRAIFI